MLILSLTACGSKSMDTNAAGNGTSAADSAKARTRAMMAEGKSMMQDAKYFAAPNGRVRGTSKDSLMDSVRSAADKAASDIRQAGDEMGNALSDMTRN